MGIPKEVRYTDKHTLWYIIPHLGFSSAYYPMVRAIDMVVSEKETEKVRDDLESILLPYYIEISTTPGRGSERRIIKYHELKKRNNQTHEKLRDYTNILSLISGCFQAIIGLGASLASLFLTLMPYFYLTVADTDRKMKNRLMELYSFDRSPKDSYTKNYTNWWNSRLLKSKFISSLYILTVLLIVSPKIYELTLDTIDEVKHVEKSRKKIVRASYHKMREVLKDY